MEEYHPDERAPRILLCGGAHEICQQCVEGLAVENGKFRCPKCREEVPAQVNPNRGMMAALVAVAESKRRDEELRALEANVSQREQAVNEVTAAAEKQAQAAMQKLHRKEAEMKAELERKNDQVRRAAGERRSAVVEKQTVERSAREERRKVEAKRRVAEERTAKAEQAAAVRADRERLATEKQKDAEERLAAERRNRQIAEEQRQAMESRAATAERKARQERESAQRARDIAAQVRARRRADASILNMFWHIFLTVKATGMATLKMIWELFLVASGASVFGYFLWAYLGAWGFNLLVTACLMGLGGIAAVGHGGRIPVTRVAVGAAAIYLGTHINAQGRTRRTRELNELADSLAKDGPFERARLLSLAQDQTPHKWLVKMAEDGHVDSMMKLSVRLKMDGKEELSFEYLKMAADAGDRAAQQDVGKRYDEGGSGVSVDVATAAHYLKLAADQGLADAQAAIGWKYAYGEGVPKNDAEAVRYYELALKGGRVMPNVEYGLSRLLYEGDGVEHDHEKSFLLCRSAFQKGDAQATKVCGNAAKAAGFYPSEWFSNDVTDRKSEPGRNKARKKARAEETEELDQFGHNVEEHDYLNGLYDELMSSDTMPESMQHFIKGATAMRDFSRANRKKKHAQMA